MIGKEYKYRRETDWYILYRKAQADVDVYRFTGEGQVDETDDIKCSEFACGKSLSPQEQLFGDRCPQHQKRETTLSIIDKHLSL